jgi:hypothetical protein
VVDLEHRISAIGDALRKSRVDCAEDHSEPVIRTVQEDRSTLGDS